jgi:hypothetical protein
LFYLGFTFIQQALANISFLGLEKTEKEINKDEEDI